jgi:two-component system NarL family sensor kinase
VGSLVIVLLLGGPLAFGTSWNLDVVAMAVLATTFTAVGVAVATRVPRNRFGWLMLAIGATSAITMSTWSDDVPGALVWVRSWMVYVPASLLPIALLLFPTGRLPSHRWRAALYLAVAGAAISAFFLAVASAMAPDPLGFFGVPAGHAVAGLLAAARLGVPISGLALALGVLSLFLRLRSASDVERRQILCLFVGAIALFAGLALDFWGLRGAWIAGAATLPVAAGVAILWHRLYDLDLFLNRSLVYAGLSGTLIAAFLAIVWLGDHLARSLLPDGTGTLVAVALVALGVDPLRRRLQHAVDHLLYGNRDDPYAVVTALGRGLSASSETPAMLTDVAEGVARNLALPFVAIEVPAQDGTPRVAPWGRLHGEPVGVELVHRGEQVGRMLVTPRTIGAELSAHDRRLLEDLAPQVALTVHAVELSAGLQRAREQLVATREEERRRLRRDLHDGMGPTLAAMVMQLDAAANLLHRDPAAVEPVLAGLRIAAQDAVSDVRQLVYDLRPPALDELGLIGAIRESAERFSSTEGDGLMLSLETPAMLAPIPAAVEVAALRIVQEALANVARHSGARACVVRLSADGPLVVEVEDDGRGLPVEYRRGVGLGSMRERAAELGGTLTVSGQAGGGTRVHAVLPLPVP